MKKNEKVNQKILDELISLYKQENKFLERCDKGIARSAFDPAVNKIKEKIPENVAGTLETAFYKAFKLVYEKGYDYIEKTYDKDKLQLEHQLNNYRLEQDSSARHLKGLDKQASDSRMKNSLVSVLEGSVLGFLGIGLPDIPLLIAMIIKTVSEIGFSYGYDCDNNSDSEKAYMLLLIAAAVSRGEKQQKFNQDLNRLGEILDHSPGTLPEEFRLNRMMEQTSKALSEAMLTAKFVQGIAIVGVVGGVVNFSVMNRISEYARLKYKRRYLLGKTISNQRKSRKLATRDVNAGSDGDVNGGSNLGISDTGISARGDNSE